MDTVPSVPQRTAELRATLYACGVANLVAFVVLIPLSYGIAVVSPFGLRQEDKIDFLQRVLTPSHDLGPLTRDRVRRYLSGDSPLASRATRSVVYAIVLLIPTVSFLQVTARLRRYINAVDETVVSLLFKLSVAFGVANVLAYPMFTQDFWLSVVWGRMLLDGTNPYYEYFTPGALSGLPLLYFKIHMTYGPLWARICQTLAFVCGRDAVVEFLCFKLALLVAWTVSLALTRRILADAPPGRRALALCIVGWLPMSAQLSIGEGHNDIVMVSFLLLWMLCATRRHDLLSPFALIASALIKYITAPLAAVELLRTWLGRARTPRTYPIALLLSAVAGGVVLASLWQGAGFFAAVTDMRDWSFFTPAHAIVSLAKWLHVSLPLALVSVVLRVAAAGAVLYYALRYYRDPTFAAYGELILALLCAILLTQVGHVWPWFIVWVVAPAAIVARSELVLLVIALALVAPFMGLYWLMAPGWEALPAGSVAFYALTAGALLLLPREGWVTVGPVDTHP